MRPSAPPVAASSCLRRSLGTAQLFSGEVSGLIVRLPDWTYPVVIDTTTGQVHYDNYDGAWGDQAQLDRFLQIYAVEKATDRGPQEGPPDHRAVPGRRLDQADHPRRRWLMKIIEITVDAKGQTKVETRGFTGGECREASKFIEQALGQRTDEKLTAEFYQGQTTDQQLKQSN